MTARLEHYFQATAPALPGHDISAVKQARAAAWAAFQAAGFPTTRHEEWKFSSVLPLLKLGAHPVNEASLSREPLAIDSFTLPGLEANLVVLVNGRFDASLSQLLDKPAQLTVQPLFHGGSVPAGWNEIAVQTGNPFVELNTALAPGGVHIHIPAGQSPAHPIHLLHLTAGGSVVTCSWSRILVNLDAGATATLIQSHAAHDTAGWETTVSEVNLAPQARLHWTEVQDSALNSHLISHREVQQAADSHFSAATFTFAGRFVRNNLHIHLNGSRSEALLHGLYLLRGSSHADNHTLVDHAVPHCHSNELYKGVMMEQSRGVFNGKILVRPQAQKTLAYQSNKNILLSSEAEVNTKPQLEIFADDVKCSHGATTGRLDANALFYLRARGVPEAAAKALLTRAFAGEVVDSVQSEPLKEWLLNRIEKSVSHSS